MNSNIRTICPFISIILSIIAFGVLLQIVSSPLWAAPIGGKPVIATFIVKIESVEALDCFDDFELIGLRCFSEADFRPTVTINDEQFESPPTIEDRNKIMPTDWVFAKAITVVAESAQSIGVEIKIWDIDSDLEGGDDDEANLTLQPGNPLKLTVNLNDCIEERPNAIVGNYDGIKNCQQSITTEGDVGNPARIVFRVTADVPRNTIVVKDELGTAIPNAEIWHFRNNEYRRTLFLDNSGSITIPCLLPGDELMAVQLIETKEISDISHEGWHYRTYITNLDFSESGEALPVEIIDGQCGQLLELIIRKSSPLILFNLVVSLGWASYGADANVTDSFLQRLERALFQASELIFDVTDGQFAIGNVTIYHGRGHWNEADIQILPSNYRRPYAIPGGITRQPAFTYTSQALNTTVFMPGQIRFGRAWNEFGEPDASLDDPNGIHMIAHEFAHYAFMVFDEYFYFNDANQLQPAECPDSFMDDLYMSSELSMQGIDSWHDSCTKTEQFLIHGESTWETLTNIYADTMAPPRWTFRVPSIDNPPLNGPNEFPFELMEITTTQVIPLPELANTTGKVQLTIRSPSSIREYTGQTRIVTLRRNVNDVLRIFDQGTTNELGVIELVGVKENDVVTATSWDGRYFASQTYTDQAGLSLELEVAPWKPSVVVYPITDDLGQSSGIHIELEDDGLAEGRLVVALLAADSFIMITDTVSLTETRRGHYEGTWVLSSGESFDVGHIWIAKITDTVGEINKDLSKQIVLPISLSGSLGSHQSPGSHKRSYPPKHAASNDGYCELHLPDADWAYEVPLTLMTPRSVPELSTENTLISTPCYIGLSPETNEFADAVNLTMYINGRAASGFDESRLHIIRWDNSSREWHVVENVNVDLQNRLLSTVIDRPGLYVAIGNTGKSPLPTNYTSFLPVIR